MIMMVTSIAMYLVHTLAESSMWLLYWILPPGGKVGIVIPILWKGNNILEGQVTLVLVQSSREESQ